MWPYCQPGEKVNELVSTLLTIERLMRVPIPSSSLSEVTEYFETIASIHTIQKGAVGRNYVSAIFVEERKHQLALSTRRDTQQMIDPPTLPGSWKLQKCRRGRLNWRLWLMIKCYNCHKAGHICSEYHVGSGNQDQLNTYKSNRRSSCDKKGTRSKYEVLGSTAAKITGWKRTGYHNHNEELLQKK